MSKVQVDTIDTRSGTSTMQIGSTNTSTINIGVSGDTVNIPSGVTIANAGTATGFGLDGTPNFLVYRSSSDQTISNNTYTKVQFQSESYDSDNAYDNSSNYRFTVPSGEGGKYALYSHVWMRGTDVTMMNYYGLAFYKNGSAIWEDHWNFTNSDIRSAGASIALNANLSAGDYIEVYGRININSGSPSFGNDSLSSVPTTWFQGYRLA